MGKLTAESSSEPQTVLVVDDEPEVRGSTALLVETLGFAVMEAVDGPSAIAALEQNPSIALLFTDVVLPGGMKGTDLAKQALTSHPDLKVLLTSGSPKLLEEEGHGVIRKPFRLAELAEKIEEMLGDRGDGIP